MTMRALLDTHQFAVSRCSRPSRPVPSTRTVHASGPSLQPLHAGDSTVPAAWPATYTSQRSGAESRTRSGTDQRTCPASRRRR